MCPCIMAIAESEQVNTILLQKCQYDFVHNSSVADFLATNTWVGVQSASNRAATVYIPLFCDIGIYIVSCTTGG